MSVYEGEKERHIPSLNGIFGTEHEDVATNFLDMNVQSPVFRKVDLRSLGDVK